MGSSGADSVSAVTRVGHPSLSFAFITAASLEWPTSIMTVKLAFEHHQMSHRLELMLLNQGKYPWDTRGIGTVRTWTHPVFGTFYK